MKLSLLRINMFDFRLNPFGNANDGVESRFALEPVESPLKKLAKTWIVTV
jgi:hypothetical protein